MFLHEDYFCSCFFLPLLRRMGEKQRLKLTALPHVFIHAVCQFNSNAYSQSSAIAGVSFSTRGSDSASCPYRLSPLLLQQRKLRGLRLRGWKLFSGSRRSFLAFSTAGYAGGSAVHCSARRLGLGRAPWRVLPGAHSRASQLFRRPRLYRTSVLLR